MDEKPICGIPWYRPGEWDQWKAISSDSMFEHHNEWLRAAEEAVQELTGKGFEVHRVDVDVSLFKIWMTSRRGLNINNQARADYANHLLAKKFGLDV